MIDNLINEIKSSYPKYSIIQPSTKKPIYFRPFNVKEEKTLLMSKNTSSYIENLKTLIDVIEACYELTNVKNLPYFDVEYMFLKLRSKSIGEQVKIEFTCPITKENIIQTIDLEKINPVYSNNNNAEMNFEKFKIYMRYPTIFDIASDNNDYYDLIVKCIDKIETKEELIECKNISAEKIEQFVDALSSSQFNQIIEFMKTIPKLEYKIDYTTTDGENRSIAMRGIKDFF